MRKVGFCDVCLQPAGCRAMNSPPRLGPKHAATMQPPWPERSYKVCSLIGSIVKTARVSKDTNHKALFEDSLKLVKATVFFATT